MQLFMAHVDARQRPTSELEKRIKFLANAKLGFS